MYNIQSREQIAEWLNKNGLVGTAVEVGVMHGGFSRMVLPTWKGKQYVMVDPWERQDPKIYKERTEDVPYDQKYLDCVAIANEYQNVKIIRDYSVNASKQFEDGSIDWVFIDANHAFEAVTDDMNAWWPKLRPGGLFSGHDYGDDTNWPHFCQVKSAVDKWMKEHEIHFRTTYCSSWWARKK